ncbi:hypothetical protein Tco_0501291, partial [Tanacetum coccineum]
AGGGGGGACASAGTGISRATSLAARPSSWAPAAAACCLSGSWATQAHVSPYLMQMLSLPSLCKSIKGSSRVTT